MSCGTRDQYLARAILWRFLHPSFSDQLHFIRTLRTACTTHGLTARAATFTYRYCDCVYCCLAVRLCQALSSLWAATETITTPLPNVYYGQDRFPRIRG